MYTLYWSPGTASLCVHWMLIELGEPHELVQVDIEAGEHRKPEYLKLNPSGVVPTLVVDGVPLGEAAALCMILAERHPQAGFAPAIGHEQRAAYQSWMFFLSNTLQIAYHNWFYPDQPAGQSGRRVGEGLRARGASRPASTAWTGRSRSRAATCSATASAPRTS